MTTELTKAAQQALEALEAVMRHVRREAPHLTGKLWGFADSSADALRRALTQRPAAQTEREADGYGSTDLPWSFTVCRELEPQEKRLMSMLVSAFGSDHPAIDDMAHLILNRPASLPAHQQATPDQFADASKMVQATPPQQAAGEPVGEPCGYLSPEALRALRNDGTRANLYPTRIYDTDVALFTHPAPGVPEGFALVPMTIEQMRAMLTEAGYDDDIDEARGDFINGIRYAEAHHRIGITAQGAQGGGGER